MSLTKDQILAADDLKRERVNVPEWAPTGTDTADAFVYVRTMTGEERDQFEEWWLNAKRTSLAGVRAEIAALTMVDDDGNRLFTADDVAALSKKSAAPLANVFNTASRLNALLPQDVEELEKNSAPTADANSTLNSPVT